MSAIVRGVAMLAIALVVLVSPTLALGLPSGLADLSDLSDLAVEQSARLASPKANTPVPIYLRPAPNQPNVGYGPDGAVVTVIEQAADYFGEGNPQTTWNHIRLETPPYTEGWLQGRFLSFPGGASAPE